ncbi:MAG TPA: GAF domain-containing protein [Anaerolineales bacterium]|nr:GAF domain-containing protein [Anaerolineales bacterium]
MGPKDRPADLSSWRELASLGEQLASATSLAAQRDRITAMAGRLLRGRVSVWLDEKLFRLPDRDAARVFPSKPRSDAMRRAVRRRELIVQRAGPRNRKRRALAALPIEDQGLLLGALQVARGQGPAFTPDELDLLASFVSVVAVGLYASHRVEVERFRLGQLNLVRQVSAEIATVLDTDELARRVTQLIQKTFHYYYVAIFTLTPGATHLRFRSSAGVSRQGAKPAPLAFDVELGQGLIGEAAARGERVLAANVRKDPRYRYIDLFPETQSEVVIPLKLEGVVLGILDVQSNRLDAFHPNDLLLLGALADNIARAVESARLYSDLRRRAEQLTLVAEVSRTVSSTLELDRLLSDASQLIHERFGYPHVSFFTVHSNRRLIQYVAGSGKRSRALQQYAIPLDEARGIIPWVAREGRSILANDVSQDPRYMPSAVPPRNTQAELCVPLSFGEHVLGVLDIQADRRNAFTEDDLILFEAVAGTIAASIRNADLYRSEQWRRSVGESLREVAGLLSDYVSVDQALESILTELERNLPVEVSAIWLFEDGELYLAAAHGVDRDELEAARQASPDATDTLLQILTARQPTIRQPSDPMWPSGLAAGFDADYSSLAAPLRVSEQPVGMLALAHHGAGRFGHEAQAMTATFASYAAVAIENARLYDQTQEQAYASAALLQVAQAVASLSTLDEILGTVVRTIPILVGVERAALYFWDASDEMYVPAQEFGLPASVRGKLWDCRIEAGSFPMLDAARQRGRTVSRALRPRETPENWLKMRPSREVETPVRDGSCLLLAVPLLIKADLFGMLLVEESRGAQRFRSRRLEIIHGIAQQAALAIQSDRLQGEMVVRERLETEVQLARQIQRAFIPQTLPEHEGWQLAGRWETARQVGGDFYDVIELPGRKLGIFIGDVADKGMPAALFMALTRTLVHAAVVRTPSPAEAMQHVNDLLIPDAGLGMFVTAVYGVVDLDTHAFTYANAGHNPPLWIRRDGQIERLTRTGIALGIIEGETITERTIRLEQGDALLLYTDGITEAFSPEGNMFGDERLLENVEGHRDADASALLDGIDSQVKAFMGALPLSDDMTMLAVKRV